MPLYISNKPEFVKIPANIPTTDKKKLKALCVYFALKQYRYTGKIYEYKKNINQLSEELGISPNNLRSKIRELFTMDLIRFEGKHLQLCKYSYLCKTFGINERYIKIKNQNVKQLELLIYALKIKENFKKQQFSIDKKLVIWETTQVKTFIDKPELFSEMYYPLLIKKTRQRSEKNISKLSRKLNRLYKAQLIEKHKKAQMIKNQTSYGFNFVNPTVTLSYSGIARNTTGSKNSATGMYMFLKLQRCGLLSARNRVVHGADHESINRNVRNFNTWENSDRQASVGLFGFRKKSRNLENLVKCEF